MTENSDKSPLSRRGFLASTGVLLTGSALGLDRAGTRIAEEPIIDIHQHTDYMGRTNEQLIAHQKKLGATLTLLLPAGIPAFGFSTHLGTTRLTGPMQRQRSLLRFGKKTPGVVPIRGQ